MKPSQWLLIVAATLALALAGCAGGEDGAPGPAGPPGTSVFDSAAEACSFCHRDGTIADIDDVTGTHAPAAATVDYWTPTILGVTWNSTGDTLTVRAHVADGTGADVTGLVAADRGMRFTLARLDLAAGDTPEQWENYTGSSIRASGQYTDATGGVFAEVGLGVYTWTFASYSDDVVPTTLDWLPYSASANTWRIGMQAGVSGTADSKTNDWLDFVPNGMVALTEYGPGGAAFPTPVTDTRDVVATQSCNECHDADGDTFGLAIHGSDRRNVEFCVTCHNDTFSNNRDFKQMVHKIHMGKALPSVEAGATTVVGVAGFAKGGFPQPITNCTKCHDNGLATDADNWMSNPSIEACGSCHDTTTFDGVASTDIHGDPFTHDAKTNSQCAGCHNEGVTAIERVSYAHRTAQIKAEAAKYTTTIQSATYSAGTLTVVFDVQDDTLTKLNLASHEIFTTSGASFNLKIGWKNSGKADYTNDGAGGSDPASPLSLGIVSGSPPTLKTSITMSTGATATVTDDGSQNYTVVVPLPTAAQSARTGIAFVDGHPAKAVLAPDLATTYDRLPVKNAVKEFAISGTVQARREVVSVDTSSCDACHDGLSLHGNNRQGDVRVCTTCHNSANTDLARRPLAGAVDGKAEEAIDFKRLIHRIHAGRDTQAGGVTLYGFSGNPDTFAGEFPPGAQLNNCSTCHDTVTPSYKPELVAGIEGTTIDSGVLADRTDDLNISPTTAVCSSCHDGGIATNHMQVMGGSFSALEEDILY